MKLQDLLLVADCNYHVFFKTDMADISGFPYTEIKKEQLNEIEKLKNELEKEKNKGFFARLFGK